MAALGQDGIAFLGSKNPLFAGIGVQTSAVLLTQSVNQFLTGSGTVQDFSNVVGNVGNLINAVGVATKNNKLELAGNLITAYGNTLNIVANWSSSVDIVNSIESIFSAQSLVNDYISQYNYGTNTLFSIPDSSSLGSMISADLANAQKQIVDPLVISMDGKAVTTTSVANGTFVDLQGTGFAEQSSWFSSNAGILVDVTNPNGTLNNGFTVIGSTAINQNGNALVQTGKVRIDYMASNAQQNNNGWKIAA